MSVEKTPKTSKVSIRYVFVCIIIIIELLIGVFIALEYQIILERNVLI